MVFSTKNSTIPTASAKAGGRRPQTQSWAQVAQRQTLSAKPVRLNQASLPSTSTAASRFADQSDEILHDNIRPYLHGIEKNSTLVNITGITDLKAVKRFFASLNSEEHYPFLGSLLVERRYLQRRFIETVWDENSDEYKRLTDEGLLMNDGTLLRGYPSLPPDAKIARVKIERLPFMIPRTLRDLMMKRFAHFGTVLDVGLDFDEGTFFGQGYVILDLNCPHPSQPETLECIFF